MTSTVMWRLKACQKDKNTEDKIVYKNQSGEDRGCDLEGDCMTVMTAVSPKERAPAPVGTFQASTCCHSSSPTWWTRPSPRAPSGRPPRPPRWSRSRWPGLPVVNCFPLRSKLRLVSAGWWRESGPEGPTRPTRPGPPTTRLVHSAARHRPAPPLIGNKTPIVHEIKIYKSIYSIKQNYFLDLPRKVEVILGQKLTGVFWMVHIKR